MKRSAKFAALAACVLLGACSTLPFGQPAPKAKAKPRPRPAAQQALSIPAAPAQNPAQPAPPVVAVPTPVAPTSAETSSAVATSPVVTPAPVDKGDADSRFKAALDLLKQNQPQEAEAALSGLSKDFPQFGGPFTDLGILYAKSKRVQPAIAAFTRAAAINPQNATSYNWLGILLCESQDYVRAEQAYKKALAINPDHAAANLNLGMLYDTYLGRPHEALPYYRNYQRLGGQDDLRVLVWIAQIEKLPPPPPIATPSVPKPAVTTSRPKPKTQGALPGIPAPQEKRP